MDVFSRIRERIVKLLYRVRRKCDSINWFGSEYGGFYVATDLLNKNSNNIIFDFGIGEDISFDIDIDRKYQARILGFDPTPKSQVFINLTNTPEKFEFYPWGISSVDGIQQFYLPENDDYVSGSIICRDDLKQNSINVQMKKFSTITEEMGISHIDILKMDVEGSEYDVIEDILTSGIDIRQICVEIHGRFFGWRGIIKDYCFVRKLLKNGYQCVAASKNLEEFTFIKI